MPTDSKPARTLTSVPPGVESCHRDTEVCGEFVDGEKPIETDHVPIMRCHPVIRVSSASGTTAGTAVAGRAPCHQSVSSPVRIPPTRTQVDSCFSGRFDLRCSGHISDSVPERCQTASLLLPCVRQGRRSETASDAKDIALGCQPVVRPPPEAVLGALSSLSFRATRARGRHIAAKHVTASETWK